MTTTDSMATAATLAGLVVAGLSVYAYTQLGAAHEHDTRTRAQPDAPRRDTTPTPDSGEGARKARRKRRGKAAAEDGGAGADKGEGKERGRAGEDASLPGGFAAAPDGAPAGPTASTAKATKKLKKAKAKEEGEVEVKVKAQAQAQAKTQDEETGKPDSPTPKKKAKKKAKQKKQGEGEIREVAGRAAGDSTDADASVSLSPSASGTAWPLARVHAQRELLRSLSVDTDSSWTHVGRRRDRVGRAEAASSDLASTESGSPIAERGAGDIRGARGGEKRTLAEKLVPKPEGTSVDDMLEQPDVSTLARVMRVQPPVDETPVPGFSWDDYGDVVEESVLVHDADQEDEGEWGIVKSRNRTRPTQVLTAAAPPQATAPPETMTKKQRQNARKRELAKAVKAEAEAARLQGLSKHKRELERLRIIEQSRQGGGKQTSGGMHASVDNQGKLVWE